MPVRTIWSEGERVYLVDQTLLPETYQVLEIRTVGEMWEAIRILRVRGAPAIGIAAAYGVWLAVREVDCADDGSHLLNAVNSACDYLAKSRPTAVNLFWALDRIRDVVAANLSLSPEEQRARILAEADAMVDEDNAVCLELGRHGASLLKDGARVLTHCNAGGLATARYGTALAAIYFAVEREGKSISVFADETRPLLQGARLTAWELHQAQIPVTVICDNMAATVMRRGWVDAVIVGTDRAVRNGDFANKIGTYGLAILARHHGVPFYVSAPLSSVDIMLENGDSIPIEERDPTEVAEFAGKRTAPVGASVFNPAFDVTPHDLVTAFITEKGIVRPPYLETIPRLFS